jgi:hypothetical protein
VLTVDNRLKADKVAAHLANQGFVAEYFCSSETVRY